MNNTLSEELQQIFAEMEAAGLNPRLCDTPVPYYDTSVVAGLLNHGHLPVASELRRMAVQSFCKPTALWERTDAPVSGQRFDDYLAIARTTHEKLSKRR